MKSPFSTPMRLALALALGAMLGDSLLAQAPANPSVKGVVEKIKVHGKSLEGNLEGDSPDRDVFIYLPPGYAANSNQRYPVVYLLHGYGLTAERWMPFTRLADAADKNIAAGTMKEMILINPDAFTVHSGSMYSSSPTIGDWETYIAEDLVSYVDSHYRTIPERMSRGLGGHSMGGYGTIRIGMKRPDVFSSMYIMSACCLLNNPGAGGRGAGAGAGTAPATAPGTSPATSQRGAEGAAATPVNPAPAVAGNPATAVPEDNRSKGLAGGAGAAGIPGGTGGGMVVQSRQSSDILRPPRKDGQPQPGIAAKWVANSPLVMVDQYLTNLKKYHAIMMDVGTQDSLAGSNRQLDESLKTFNIVHTFETYEGDHTNRVPARIETRVLPFFSNSLTFNAPKK